MNESNSFEQAVAYAQRVKDKYETELLAKKNVVAVGIGFKNKTTDTVAIVVNVTHKVPLNQLEIKDQIPNMLAGVPVDVVAVGTIRAF